MNRGVFSIPPRLTPAAIMSQPPATSVGPLATSISDGTSPAFSMTPSAASSPSPLRDDPGDDVGDVCSAAMNLVTVLDTEALSTLERRMGTKVFSRSEVIELLVESINACKMVTNPFFTTLSETGEPLRKSDADFRSALRSATTFPMVQLEALVVSVDKHGADKIRFSDLMSFFVAAGRRVAPAAGDNHARSPMTNSPHRVESTLRYEANEIITSASYVTIVAVVERNCFLAATLRWIDIVDEHLAVLPVTRRIAPPQGDPSMTIVAIDYAPVLDEVVVGFKNMKIMTFNFSDGRKQREVSISGIPLTLRCVSSTLGGENIAQVGDAELGTTVLCGADNGSMIRISLLEHAAIRVFSSTKLAATKFTDIVPFFDLGIVVCVSGKCLLVCDAATGSLLRPPFVADGIITAAAKHASTNSLLFASTASVSCLFQFQRRTLKSSSRLENPTQIFRHSPPTSSAPDTISLLVQDAYKADNLVSITACGVISLWDINRRRAASLIPEDGPEVQLRLPPTAKSFSFAASLPSRQGVILGGKTFVCSVTRSTHSVVLVEDGEAPSAQNQDVTPAKLQAQFDGVVASFSLQGKHSAFPHASRCMACVYPQGVQVLDMGSNELVAELSFGASPLAAQRGTKQPLRIRSACLGPGLMLLLGSDCGDLHSFSLEAASLGDCEVVARGACVGEVSDIFCCSALSTVGFSSFDGTLITASLSPHCNGITAPITATTVHRCDALSFNEELNLLAVADFAEQLVRLFSLVTTGTRLKQIAKVSLFGLKCVNLSAANHTPSTLSPAQFNKTVKLVIAPAKPHLTKQLFQEESDVCRLLLTTSIQGSSEGSCYTQLVLRRDEEDGDQSFLTNLTRKSSGASPYHLLVECEEVLENKAVTAVSSGIDDDVVFLGFSNGAVSILDIASRLLREVPRHQSADRLESVVCICPIASLHNVAFARAGEKPSLLFKRTSRDRTACSSVGDSPLPLSPEKEATTPSSSGVRKTRSAKPERPSPVLPKLQTRSGSAGSTPIQRRAVNSILESISSRSSSRHRASASRSHLHHLPPLGKR